MNHIFVCETKQTANGDGCINDRSHQYKHLFELEIPVRTCAIFQDYEALVVFLQLTRCQMGGVFYNNTIRRRKFAQSNEITMNSTLWLCWLQDKAIKIRFHTFQQVFVKYQEAETFNRHLAYSGVLLRDLKSLLWKLLTSPVFEWTLCGVFFFYIHVVLWACWFNNLSYNSQTIRHFTLQKTRCAKPLIDIILTRKWLCLSYEFVAFSLLPNMDCKHVKTKKIDQLTLCGQTPQAL